MQVPRPRRHRLRAVFLVVALVLAGMALVVPAAVAAPPGPLLSISDADTVEGDVGSVDLVFTVRLSSLTGRIVTVDYATGGGTAFPSADYQVTRGTLTFNKKQTVATIRVPVLGDEVVEPDETVVVTLSNPGGAQLGDAAGEGLIRNDDVAAAPPPATFTLAVARNGTGTGTVVSSPSDVSCGADCSEDFPDGTTVSLTATPAAGSTFTGWSGACTGNGACSVTMSVARSVTATFDTAAAPTFNLGVVGTASPTTVAVVFSTPDGINCGTDPGQDRCTADFPAGSTVTLQVAVAQGTFSGWGGDCAGTPPQDACTVVMSADRLVEVTFT